MKTQIARLKMEAREKGRVNWDGQMKKDATFMSLKMVEVGGSSTKQNPK